MSEWVIGRAGSLLLAAGQRNSHRRNVLVIEPTRGVERGGAPPNNVNAADDELRFAPLLAADPQGRSAAKGAS